MIWHAEKSGKRGRPETFSEAAIQACLALKVLFGLPLRQTVRPVESLIGMAGLDWPGALEDVGAIPCSKPGRSQNELPETFRARIMSRDADHQAAEIQIHIAIMNRFSVLGTAEIEAAA